MIEWYTQTINGSSLWAGIGFGAVIVAILVIALLAARVMVQFFKKGARRLARRRRENTRGYFIAVAPIRGRNGKTLTRTLIDDLTVNMAHFSFGTPVEVFAAPPIHTSKTGSYAEQAREWIGQQSANVISWSSKPPTRKDATMRISLLSRESTLSAAEAKLSKFEIPKPSAAANKHDRIAVAYLFARALLPGLAAATAFRPQKIHSVATILSQCLENCESLPASARETIEADYCRMALHLNDETHLKKLVKLRHARLSAEAPVDQETQLQSRLDLGRAQLALSDMRFDAARVREAMDHLRVAHDMIVGDERLRLAADIVEASRKGQAMLAAPSKPVSILSGGVL